MKKTLLILLTWVVAIAAGNGLAGEKSSFERLLRTRKCPGCNFYKVSFHRIDLTEVNLRGANLAYATFREATLYKADLTGADLRGTVFDGAIWVDGTMCQSGSVGMCRRKAK